MRKQIANVILATTLCVSCLPATAATLTDIPAEYRAIACGDGYIPCLVETRDLPTAVQIAVLNSALDAQFGAGSWQVSSYKESNTEGAIIGTGTFSLELAGRWFVFTPGFPVIIGEREIPTSSVIQFTSVNDNNLMLGILLKGGAISDVFTGINRHTPIYTSIIPDPRFPDAFVYNPASFTHASFGYIDDLNRINATGVYATDSGFASQRFLLLPVSDAEAIPEPQTWGTTGIGTLLLTAVACNRMRSTSQSRNSSAIGIARPDAQRL